MEKLLRLALLSSLPLFIQGCGPDAVAEDQVNELNYSVIHSETSFVNIELQSKGHRVFSSQEAYESELLNYSNELPVSIDFTQSQVVLLDMGVRPTSGYSIGIEEITENEDYVLLTVALYISKSCGNSVSYTQALTHPFEFVEVTTSKEILIEEKLVSGC
jgi:hypothetical protein